MQPVSFFAIVNTGNCIDQLILEKVARIIVDAVNVNESSENTVRNEGLGNIGFSKRCKEIKVKSFSNIIVKYQRISLQGHSTILV